jgi:c(7)-type cytochrome triheme protein
VRRKNSIANERWRWIPLAGLGLVCGFLIAAAEAGKWRPLKDDGLHDPKSPAIGVLQEPAAALRVLPGDTAGNKVDWVNALRSGYIKPRAKIRADAKVRVLDTDILMTNTGDAPIVRFPHKTHTEWLDCSNCHEKIFKSKAGATRIGMLAILQGEYCGRCHGAVSFPLTECNRCHSVSHRELEQIRKGAR